MRHGNIRAIFIMLAGVAFFALLDAGLKQLSASYAPMQVMFLRSAASLPVIALAISGSRAWGTLRIHNPYFYLARGALGVLVLWTFIYAVSVQSLSYTYAIFMSAPLFVAVLAGRFFGEHVPLRRWLAIAVGLCGVLVALKPSGSFVGLGGIAASVSALSYAFYVMAIRLIKATESNYAVVFWHFTVVSIIAGCLAFPDWRPVAGQTWLLVLYCGITGALGQYFFTVAFRLAPASTLAPFEYTAMLWGIGLDLLVFRLVPMAHVLLGAGIVIAAGLYVIWDESRTGRPMVVELPPG